MKDFKLVHWSEMEDCKPDQEYVRRDGYREGWINALNMVDHLASIGYSQPGEIANLMEEFAATDLKAWTTETGGPYTPVKRFLAGIKPRAEIHQKFLELNGRTCERCRSVKNIEVDYLNPIDVGGLPFYNNLRALCQSCIKTKSDWDI